MFIGHLALGFAAKRVTPHISLAVLFVAAQLADLLWPVLLAVGIETVRIDPGNTAFTPLDFVSYPYSHSLMFLVIWGVLLAWAYRLTAGNRHAFLVIASLVVSHWVLDFLTHRPDMPLYPGGPKFGMGLWNSIPGTMAIELPLYGLGVWVYVRTTRARDTIGHWAFVSLVAFLVLAYVANVAAPPPPSVPALYWTAIVGAIVLTMWAWWADRHRDSTTVA